MKLTDHTCVCNSLTNFEYVQVKLVTGNGNQVNLLKFAWKVKSHQVNLFLAGFSYLEPPCNSHGKVTSLHSVNIIKEVFGLCREPRQDLHNHGSQAETGLAQA